MKTAPILATLALMLTTAAAHATPGWTSAGVNFRAGPGTGHPVLAYLPRCAALEVERTEYGWAYANWQGTWGWVAQSYLRYSDAHCHARGGYGHARPRY